MSQLLSTENRVDHHTCYKCDETKPIIRFYVHNGLLANQCKTCYRKVTKAWAARNPDKKRRSRRESARKRYKVDPRAFRRRQAFGGRSLPRD